MSKRFGEGVSLQDMEAFAVNRTLAELRETAKRAEENKYRRLEKKKVGTLYISFFLFGPSTAPKVKRPIRESKSFFWQFKFSFPCRSLSSKCTKKGGVLKCTKTST